MINLGKIPKHVTKTQITSIKFCEKMLGIRFKGKYTNYNSVSAFLRKYLHKAKKESLKQEEQKKKRMQNFNSEWGDIISLRQKKRG